MEPDDFVLPVDKPPGPTSHDVVGWARKGLGRRRVGHTGTLDPFASGLLLLCVGRSTRLAEYLTGLDKSYEAVARLGQRTDTLDRDGRIVDETEGWRGLDETRIRHAFSTLVGEVDQLPPAYSAKKVGGEAAHRRARRGEVVELSPTRVTIASIEVTSCDLPLVSFRLTCSSGTYVRSLARDVGEALAVGAHLKELRRTRIGAFDVVAAMPASELADGSRVRAAAVDPLSAVDHMPRVDVCEEKANRLMQGQAVTTGGGDLDGPVAISHAGGLLAIGESRGGSLRPRKVFAA